MLQTLITGTVGPVPIYKNRPVPVQSTVDRMWFKISTKICSNSSTKWLPDRLFSLGLPHFRLLVSFSEDIVERGAGDGTLELDGAPRTLLLYLLLHSLLVLAPIQNRPMHLARVALRVVQLHAFGVDKVKSLKQ